MLYLNKVKSNKNKGEKEGIEEKKEKSKEGKKRMKEKKEMPFRREDNIWYIVCTDYTFSK